MASEHTFGEQFRAWVQTSVLIAATVWGVYTFVYKEITVPRSAPVNISVNLALKKIGASIRQSRDEMGLVAVEMRVSATNPSHRQVDLFPSVWIAHGLTIAPSQKDSASFTGLANEALKSGGYEERNTKITAETIVATGRLFPDTALKPGETVSRILIIHVPVDRYDVLMVESMIPSAANARRVELVWTLGADSSLIPTMYHIGDNGQRAPMSRDKDGSYSDAKLDLQMATSVSQLSLWQ